MKKSLWKLILQLHAEGDGGDGGTGGGSPAAGNPGGGDPNSDGAGGGAPGAGNGGGNPAGNPPGNENGFRKNPFGDGNPGNQQKPVIPDKYEFKLAEGLEIAPAVAEEFTGIAKELGLTQAGVDKLVDLHGRLMLESVKQAEAQRDTWAEECAKQGLATPQAMANAKLAVDTFGGGEAMNILVQTGAAWHPAIQKMLQNIGSLLQEDNTPDGKPAGKQPSAADMMFPNSKYE